MFLARINLKGGETADKSYYVKSVKEIHDFVSAQFTDISAMPQDIHEMDIVMVDMLIQVDGKYINNPEYVSNI